MRRIVFIERLLVLGALLCSAGTPVLAFSSVKVVTVSASAVVGGGAVPLVISAVPLDSQVYFGKNVVISLSILTQNNTPIDTKGLTVSLVYQLLNASGQSLSPVTNSPVTNLQIDPSNPAHLQGTAVIDVSNLAPIADGGSILYYFQALQGNSATVLSHAGAGVFPAPGGNPNIPTGDYFESAIINSQETTISPAGTVVSLPDTFQHDGETALSVPPGAVSAPTLLTVQRNDPSSIPPGPTGLAAVVAYTFRLQDGAQPLRPLQLTLSYPADLNGRVIGTNASASSLAPYWYGPGGWQLMSLPQLNTSLHTITGLTTEFGTFALFPVGSVNATSLRPTQRIITPNGDGINDTANFVGVNGTVTIFDIHGRRVRTLSGLSPVWDGRDDNGRIVEVGVYLYQYSVNGSRVTGVIAVAK